jgi:hypothetical protein
MTWIATAIGVIVVPGLAVLFLVRSHGPWPGILILAGLLLWLGFSYLDARNPGSVPIQPEIFGGQTIGYSQRLPLREVFWTVFVLGPATLWAALALLIGWLSFRHARRQEAQT